MTASQDRLGEVRERGGVYEILMCTGSHGDQWEPLATTFVRAKMLEGPRECFAVTVAEALEAEGWIAPSPDEDSTPLPPCPWCGGRLDQQDDGPVICENACEKHPMLGQLGTRAQLWNAWNDYLSRRGG